MEVEVDGTPVPNKPMVSVNVKQHFNIIPGQPKISGPTVEKCLCFRKIKRTDTQLCRILLHNFD